MDASEVEIKQESRFSWTLWVRGRRAIDRESFTICDRVREELLSPSGEYSEAADVADSIRRHYEEKKP